MMEIVVNGQAQTIAQGASVLDVLDLLQIARDRQGIAIAVGLSVVPRSLWAQTILQAGDRVEVVTAAQGG